MQNLILLLPFFIIKRFCIKDKRIYEFMDFTNNLLIKSMNDKDKIYYSSFSFVHNGHKKDKNVEGI